MAEQLVAARRPVSLITGASGDVGEHLARRFAAGGFDHVLVARREDRLQRLGDELTTHAVAARTVAADLDQPDTARAVFERVEGLGLEVDALVNNAGFCVSGLFAEAPQGAQGNMLRANVVGLVQPTRLVLPGMLLARHRGRVLNVASLAAYMAGPLMAVYYASKASVLPFSEAQVVEVAGSGVTVTALCPAPTATGFAAVTCRSWAGSWMLAVRWRSHAGLGKGKRKAQLGQSSRGPLIRRSRSRWRANSSARACGSPAPARRTSSSGVAGSLVTAFAL
jgi:short-subunit dehydrogenase